MSGLIDHLGALSREVADGIFQLLDPISRASLGRAYAGTGLRLHFSKTQLRPALIFDKIFKDTTWIQQVMSLSITGCPSPIVTLLGCDLVKLSHGSPSPAYLLLIISDWSGDSRYMKEQLFGSFRDRNFQFDEEASEVFFPSSSITLHIGDAITGEEWISIRNPRKVFRLEKEVLQTTALYFGDDTFYEIGPSHIGGIDDFSMKEGERVQYICSVRLKWGDGSPIYRVLRTKEIPFSLVSQSIDGEHSRMWIISWRLARADEPAWRIVHI
jgi:hypothetical protein